MDGLTISPVRSPRTVLWLAVGVAAAVVAALAAPSSALLPGPVGAAETVVSALALAAAFAVGFAAPVGSFYGVIALTVVEGAVRRWLVNDVTVFLLKDFLLVGVYAGVLPRLTWRELRRPWTLVVPLVLLVLLALLQAPHNPSLSGAVVGLRSYLIYVPLLWVAPAVVDGERRARALLALVVGLGIVESGLGIAQAIVGPGILNRLVSGAKPALLTVAGHAYLRPPGTFMQVANLADFLVFVALAAFALLSWKRSGWGRSLAVLAFVFLGGAMVYTAARTLLVSILIVVVPSVGFMLFRRRWRAAAAGPAALAAGIVLMVVVVPYVNAEVWPALRSLGGGGGGGGGAGIGKPTASTGVAGGFLGRAVDIQHAGGDVATPGLWSGRIVPQLELIADQRVAGHGTGTMTLGLEYANPGSQLVGESSYAKAAWELGIPGLVFFVWFFASLFWLSLRGFLLTSGWRNSCAAVGLGAAVLVPLWMLFTFAIDFPVVAVLFFSFVGIAVGAGTRPLSRVERA